MIYLWECREGHQYFCRLRPDLNNGWRCEIDGSDWITYRAIDDGEHMNVMIIDYEVFRKRLREQVTDEKQCLLALNALLQSQVR